MTLILQKSAFYLSSAFLIFNLNACGTKKPTTTATKPPTEKKEETKVTEETTLEPRVVFASDDLQAALARAKAEKKPIFLDFWATWCQPCRVMDESVFRDWDIADYMNANVISVKVDVDKGNGKALVLNYGVKPLPSYIFLDSEGKVLTKHEGTTTIAEFKKMMKTAFWKTRNPNG